MQDNSDSGKGNNRVGNESQTYKNTFQMAGNEQIQGKSSLKGKSH
jgi:hypothetical protein